MINLLNKKLFLIFLLILSVFIASNVFADSARRLPLNYNISTYGDETRDYQDLATWEAATDNDLVAAEKGEVLLVYDDADSYDDDVNISGATTNSDYFRVIMPAGTRGEASWQGHDGTPNNGFTLSSARDVNIIELNENYVQIQDLIIIKTANTTSNRPAMFFSNAGGNYHDRSIVGCIVKATNAGSGVGAGLRSRTLTGSIDFAINNIFYDCDDYGIWLDALVAGGGTVYAYNNTFVNIGVAALYEDNNTSGVDKNNLFYDCTANYSGLGWTTTTKWEPGTDPFIDASSDDYHIDSDDNGNGTDLDSDGTYAFDDDLDGEIWTNSDWGRGALKYVDDGYTITASSGSFSLTGTAASPLKDSIITASGSSYALTGQDVTFVLGGDRTISADGGTYNLTGKNAILIYSGDMNNAIPLSYWFNFFR